MAAVIGSAHHEAVARVDELVLAIGPKLGAPSINRRDVVLVTGPWLAGTSSVITALRRRLPQHRFVESPRLGAGAVPTAVVFVVSAATPMTESDCALLDAAAGHTDVVIAAVTKIDLHRTWREVLAANRAKLAAHAPRYGAVPWVGVAAAPQLGPPGVDDLVATVRTELAAPDIARRNRLRAWQAGLLLAGQRFNRDAAGAGRRARVDGLREERGSVLQRRRQDRTGRTIARRGQIQQARVQLCYFARSRCASVRTELQEDIAGLARRRLADFQSYARGRIDEIVTEVGDGITAQLVDVSREMSLPVDFPAADPLPAVAMPAPPLASRRLETRLMMVLGVGFGLGVALTLSRLLAGLAPGLDLGLTLAGILGCVVVGLAVALWVVRTRALLADRAVLERWTADVLSSLCCTLEQLVASRVLAAETLLATALWGSDEAANARAAAQVSAIDSELREHARAAARAAARRDREMPTIRAALEAVCAELGESGTSSGTATPGTATAGGGAGLPRHSEANGRDFGS